MKNIITFDEDLFNVPVGLYESTKSQFRKDYEKWVKELQNDDDYKNELKEMMKKASWELNFECDISQDDTKTYAFSEVLRQIYKKPPSKVVICAEIYTSR